MIFLLLNQTAIVKIFVDKLVCEEYSNQTTQSNMLMFVRREEERMATLFQGTISRK